MVAEYATYHNHLPWDIETKGTFGTRNAENGMRINIDSPIPFSSTNKHENALPFHFSAFHSTFSFIGDDAYEVSNGLDQHVVRLLATECSCGRWQLSGIPCCHAICCILDKGDDPISYLDEWYSKGKFLLAYNYPIVPIRGPNEWQKLNLLPIVPPNDTRRMTGRPKTQRRLEMGEKKNTGKVKESSCVPKHSKRQLFGPKMSVVPISIAINETASQPQ
ncbi:zinc finger, PMZ-type containing protein [Tanacetum coccineum]